MKKFIAHHLLAKKIVNLKRRRGVFNLTTAKSALLVYNATQPKDEKLVRNYARFLKEEGIKTDTIGYYQLKGKEDQRPEDELSYKYFDKHDLNMLGFIKSARILKIIGIEYNLLIDINLERNFCLKLITSLSKANFKVGIAHGYQEKVCDLTIDVNKNKSEFLQQVTTYLKMINK